MPLGAWEAGVSVGLITALGALKPEVRPSAPREEPASPIAVSMLAAPAKKAVSSAAAEPPEPSIMRAGVSPRPVPPEGDAERERSSLERIRSMLKTDPARVLAALKLHNKMFPRQRFRVDCERIESIALEKAKQQQGS